MVDSISSTPVTTGLSVTDFRTSNAGAEQGKAQPDLPSPATRVAPPRKPDAVAPVPPEMPHGESFAAALVAQHITQNSITPTELQLRMGGGWQVPDSPLRLTDRTI